MSGLLSRNLNITLTTATASATTLDIRDMSRGAVALGTVSANVTSLQLWVAPAANGTFARLFKSDGNAADLTITPSTSSAQVCSLPDQVYAAQYLKLVATHADAVGVPATVMFKS